MKKITAVLLVSALLCTFTATETYNREEITVEIDGKSIDFDVSPEMIDGRTMVPLRKIFEEIGALVKWDAETETVSARKSSKTVTLKINSDCLILDKGKTDEDGNPVTETVELDVPAQIVSGRTLVPARAISESFGLDVYWDEDNGKVVISSEEDNDDWKENKGTLELSDKTFDGEGVSFTDEGVLISSGGDFTLTGTLTEGNITVSTEEKVKLRLSGVDITTKDEPCIYVENADKAYITLTEGTKNTLTAKEGSDGAIYSKDSLEIKGKGSLEIYSGAGHGIKASDNIAIENGHIAIEAEGDGIHVNDTFKMTGGELSVTAKGDGIDSESIVIVSGGSLDITTTGEPISGGANENEKNGERFGKNEDSGDVEFEKSTKGIKAEWMMSITGGEITVDAAHHAVHGGDVIEISGGEITLSSEYGKGVSAHGNLTVSGDDTFIDVKKSTEGLESKNILTVNGGTVRIVASDDGINATGGNSGDNGNGGPGGQKNERNEGIFEGDKSRGFEAQPFMEKGGHSDMPFDGAKMISEVENAEAPEKKGRTDAPAEADMPRQAPFGGGKRENKEPKEGGMPNAGNADFGQVPGGAGRNLKDCLIINGGDIEIYAEDDCIDSNGNLIINGGIVKATNPTGTFSGAFAVIDPDGRTEIGEEAELIFAAAGGGEISLSQNAIYVYCDTEKKSGDKITVSDSDGEVIYEYTPLGKYKTVMIASNKLKKGASYTVTVGSDSHDTEISGTRTVIGTSASYGRGFERGR